MSGWLGSMYDGTGFLGLFGPRSRLGMFWAVVLFVGTQMVLMLTVTPVVFWMLRQIAGPVLLPIGNAIVWWWKLWN